MATYKKGWTPEEKKVIDTTKNTFKTVFESVKTTFFPFSVISFEDIKETFLYRYIRNFIGGLLIIGLILLVLYLLAMFVTWGITVPEPNNEPTSDSEKIFMRIIFLAYVFIILIFTSKED